MPLKVAYLMSRFPHLPETFILREMIEMERRGWEVSLYPLILQEQVLIHPEAKQWLSRANNLPFISSEILFSNFQVISTNPSKYLASIYRTITGNISSPNILFRELLLFPKIVAIAARMKSENVQHIHAHYATHPAFAAWLIHRLTDIPYSVTVHAHDIFVRRSMLATKLRDAKFVVAISNFNRDYLVKVLGEWIREKIQVIHCGIQPELYTPQQKRERTGRLEIISVGSLQPYKGFEVLIKACKLLEERSIPFRCRIIGGGKEEPRLRKLISEYGLETSCLLLGPKPQEEVARLLTTADCYVQPSVITPSGKMEGIPVGIMEALASRLSVVSTAISGVPEIIRQGETGYLVPARDAGELARAIEKVYLDPVQATQMAKNGQELVLNEFNLYNNVALLSASLAQSLGSPQTPFPVSAMASIADTITS